MMKDLLCLTIALFAATGCAKPWGVISPVSADAPAAVLLPGAQEAAGRHCESSAMLNALLYLGYPVTESMITGAGGALSFSFEKGTFPFIGARNADMREQFFSAADIEWHLSAPEVDRTKDTGWNEITRVLKSGLPVILRVDMRYLPYRYGGKYGPSYMSFGWHMVTLFGIDYGRDVALVSDTEFTSLQEVPLRDLHKARTSSTKVYPPHGEYYWAEKAPAGYAPDWNKLAGNSLDQIIGNYENGALAALERYGADLAGLETYSRQSFLLPSVLEYMAGNIEDFGTGGASFRMLYRDFLAGAAERSRYTGLAQVLPLIEDSIGSWHALSAEFRSLAARIKKMNKAEREDAYSVLQARAEDIYKREKVFYTELKKIRGED